ncbi:hypothetical protein SAMN04487926_12126 [Paraburkholderia steynii]|uniref:Uncharacterized protein n=1 Tax=Paraburkholderia steynii TaxID=1245441 RepID=A0A7Z7BC01_9BURK|nr:hypothetical protein [Paraburkholderia steynii]SDI64689.1 hypothetical protein SAMN04487926_12126 [Paraburkholderia steynii]
MRDLKFAARMVFALAAIVLILGIADKWDRADDLRIRAAYSRGT